MISISFNFKDTVLDLNDLIKIFIVHQILLILSDRFINFITTEQIFYKNETVSDKISLIFFNANEVTDIIQNRIKGLDLSKLDKQKLIIDFVLDLIELPKKFIVKGNYQNDLSSQLLKAISK